MGQPFGQGLYVQARDYQVFDAFGLLTGRMDTDTASGSPPHTAMDLDPVGFGGQYGYYQDLQTGLEHLGARYYDGGTGRFVTRDPIGYGGGENLYAFCGNNPITGSDPDGTNSLGDFAIGVLDNFDGKKIQAGLVGLASCLGTNADNEGPALSALGKGFVKGLNPLTAPNARVAGQRVGSDALLLAAGAGTVSRLRALTAGASEGAAAAIPESYINRSVTVDMRLAPGTATNAAGFPRNGPWFWREVLREHSGMFDDSNAELIRTRRAPIVNEQWVRSNPMHRSFMGQILTHHHIDQGPIATPLPEGVHQSWHGVLHPD